MIAYFDTSALVKLVVSEADSELARQCFESASLVLTHQIAVDQELIYSAAHLTRRFPLKGYDSVHLAAADYERRLSSLILLSFVPAVMWTNRRPH